MSENIPILYRNVMDGLKTELGRSAFLWATDKVENDRYCYAAEAFAHEVEHLVDFLWPVLGLAFRQHGYNGYGKRIDLMIFHLRRHAHQFSPGRNEAWI